MATLLFLMLALDGTKVVRFKDTGVFQPLMTNEVLVTGDGHVYILNFPEAQINRYSPDGRKLGTFGAKGKGPGEFTYGTQIFWEEGKIYVFDLLTSQFSVFAKDGSFEDRFPAPGRGLTFAKLKGGWVYGDWSAFGREGNASLFWADNGFKQTKKLMELDESGQSEGLWVMSSDSKTEAKFSPLDTRPKLRTGRDGTKAYLTHPSKFLITVIDADGKLASLKGDESRIPFDEDWADERLAEQKENNPNLPSIKTDYPDYFSAIRELIVDPDGELVVDRWRGKPGDNHYPTGLSGSGKETKPAYSWAVLSRLAGSVGGDLFITTYDNEEEEAGLARVPKSQVEKFVVDNPIAYEGSSGRSISISL